jgi:hypothetical protein
MSSRLDRGVQEQCTFQVGGLGENPFSLPYGIYMLFVLA